MEGAQVASTIMSADLSGITALTDENDVTVDISAYTLSISTDIPQAGGGMQGPGGQGSSDSQSNDVSETPQISDSENTESESGQGEKNGGMQFAYWLINPYYEEIYGRVGNVSTLNDLRADFLSNDFWLYVLDKLYDVINTGWDYLFIDQEFFSVVRGLFSCDLPTNTKPTLAKVNAALSQIKSFR